MEELESKILAKALGGLGGFGARFAARFLPTVPHECVFDLARAVEDVQSEVKSLLNEIGQRSPELPEGSVICGSGYLGLNPAILSIKVTPSAAGACVLIRAIAKEGLVRQDSARKLVEKVRELLRNRFD